MPQVISSFDETNFANAITTIDDLIDAAKEIVSPTLIEINLQMSARGDDGSNNEWVYSTTLRAIAYSASTPNTVMKTNLLAFINEFEDMLTASAKYTSVEKVWGNIRVIPTE